MIAEADYHNVTAWLGACRRPLLLSHRRPDGDALGALGGMSVALRALGLDPRVALYEPFPARYALIEDTAIWCLWQEHGGKLEAECDAVLVLDTCAAAQLEAVLAFLNRAPRTLVFDHHATRDPIGTRPGDLRLFDESASAVCLMVAEWVATAGVTLEPRLATALFTGIATDCGWFRFPNTDARTLRVAAELLGAGAEAHRIYAAIYQQDSPEKLWLIARMLDSLELHASGKLATMYIRQADFAASGADSPVTEDVVNEASRLGCTEATILFTEEKDDIRVNFRSKNTLDVAALARRFGGGGHTRAAGARLHGRWDEVVPAVVAAAAAALNQG
jgi:phosphoesterase RecJ-like protein